MLKIVFEIHWKIIDAGLGHLQFCRYHICAQPVSHGDIRRTDPSGRPLGGSDSFCQVSGTSLCSLYYTVPLSIYRQFDTVRFALAFLIMTALGPESSCSLSRTSVSRFTIARVVMYIKEIAITVTFTVIVWTVPADFCP